MEVYICPHHALTMLNYVIMQDYFVEMQVPFWGVGEGSMVR